MIFDRAIRRLVKALERRRFAEISRPRVSTPAVADTSRARHIPAAVRRHVWRRDAGRCAFVGPEGRCRETAFLEFHHVEPYAAGGETTAANIQLRCHAHNAYKARLFFGDGIVRESRTAWGAARSGTSSTSLTIAVVEHPSRDKIGSGWKRGWVEHSCVYETRYRRLDYARAPWGCGRISITTS